MRARQAQIPLALERDGPFAEKRADAVDRGADLGQRRLRAVRRDEAAALQQLPRSDELGIDPGCRVIHRSLSLVLLSGAGPAAARRRRCRRRQARQDLLRHQPDALFGLLVVEKARAADKDQMAEAADLVVDVHDLLVDGVRVAGAQDAAGDRLLGGDADQAVGRAARGCAPAAAAMR